MVTVAHVSDLHLRGAPCDAAALALLDGIRRAHPDAILLVTGDVTDDGLPTQYAAAERALAPWRGRLLACLGNHDAGPLGNLYDREAVRLWRAHIAPLCIDAASPSSNAPVKSLAVRDGVRVRFVGLDSVAHTLSPADFARGEIGEDQRDGLIAVLNRAVEMDTSTLVYLHHRPFPIGGLEGRVMDLADLTELREILDGVVDVVCYGHSGACTATAYIPPTALAKGTVYLDANRSVRDGSYFLIRFHAGQVPHVEQRSTKT
jgi:3',5'-cyclic AMP phosphodiesterase CpdA